MSDNTAPFSNDRLRDVLAAVASGEAAAASQQQPYTQYSVAGGNANRGSGSEHFSTAYADDGYGSNVATCGPSLDPTPMRGGIMGNPHLYYPQNVMPSVALTGLSAVGASISPLGPVGSHSGRSSHPSCSNPNSPPEGATNRHSPNGVIRAIPMGGGLAEARSSSSKSSDAAALLASGGNVIAYAAGSGTYYLQHNGSNPSQTVGLPSSSSGSSNTQVAFVSSNSTNQLAQMMQQQAGMTVSSNPAAYTSPHSPLSMANASTSVLGSTTPAQWSTAGMSPLQHMMPQRAAAPPMHAMPSSHAFQQLQQPTYYNETGHQPYTHTYMYPQYDRAELSGAYAPAMYPTHPPNYQHFNQPPSTYAPPYPPSVPPPTAQPWYNPQQQPYGASGTPLHHSHNHTSASSITPGKSTLESTPTTNSDPMLHGSGVDGAAFDDPECLTPLLPSPPPGAGKARVVLLDDGKLKDIIVPCDATPSRHPFKVRTGAARFMFNPYRTMQSLNGEKALADNVSVVAAPTSRPSVAQLDEDDDDDGVVAAADALAGSDNEEASAPILRQGTYAAPTSPQPTLHTAPPSTTSALTSPLTHAPPQTTATTVMPDASAEGDNDNEESLNAAALANGITNEMRVASKGKIVYAAVRFKYTHGVYFVNEKIRPDIAIGDMVVVEGDRGTNIGMVMEDATADVLQELEAERGSNDQKTTEFLPVLHASSNKDRKKFYQARRREGGAASIVQRIVEDLGLPIQVCDAEFQCDFQKLFVFYRLKEAEAENVTLDLRELQKDLFKQYRCRIWLLNWYTELTVHYPQALMGAAHGRQTVIDGLLQPPTVTSALRVPPPLSDGNTNTNVSTGRKSGAKGSGMPPHQSNMYTNKNAVTTEANTRPPQTIRQALNSGNHKSVARKGLLQTMPPKPPSPFAPAAPSPNGHVYPVAIMPSFNGHNYPTTQHAADSNANTSTMYSPSSYGVSGTGTPSTMRMSSHHSSPHYPRGPNPQQPPLHPPTPLGRDGTPVGSNYMYNRAHHQ